MFSFLKKKKDLPEFDFIKSYYDKEKYFVRIKKWNWLNPEQIALWEKGVDGKIKMTTMDYWLQEMFLDADGQKTILDYLGVLIKQFRDSKMEIPSDLDKFMVETLLSLKTELKAIEFSDSPTEIQTEYRNPIKE
ncbi:hypothetical protein AAEO57_19745 [Flavobacterium sp. DGU38]|jgi:hypothetical protein|uniref:Uncharacterized protein n=1 Tax=Flavobacterium calami TaxID=3139144 RepID=A0ABU9IUA8_9FLAO